MPGPYLLPTFNLVARLTRRAVVGGPYQFITDTPCQLWSAFRAGSYLMFAKLPAGLDIRDSYTAVVGGDRLEVPSGSGRVYEVWVVDDVAKGFPNEYRLATLYKKTPSVVPWP